MLCHCSSHVYPIPRPLRLLATSVSTLPVQTRQTKNGRSVSVVGMVAVGVRDADVPALVGEGLAGQSLRHGVARRAARTTNSRGKVCKRGAGLGHVAGVVLERAESVTRGRVVED